MQNALAHPAPARVPPLARGATPRVRWLFFPDYRGSVPYQDLLARAFEPWAASGPGTITDALEAASAAPVVFHLHQEDAVTATLAGDAAREAVGLFLAELDAFRACGGRLVWTMHNAAPHEDREPELAESLRAALAVRADLLHVHGAIGARLARGLGAPQERIVIVPHPDLAPGYPDDITDASARRYFRLGAEHTVFVFLGAMRAYKGLEALASAFDQLAPARPEARLIMAGRQAGSIEARYLTPSPQVLLVPRHVEDATVQYVLRAADFVVLPYRRILSSGSAALALGFGRPLIVPDLPPLLEIVRHGKEAIVYRSEEPDGLRGALDQACAMSADERLAMRGAALARGRSVGFDALAAALRVAADFSA